MPIKGFWMHLELERKLELSQVVCSTLEDSNVTFDGLWTQVLFMKTPLTTLIAPNKLYPPISD